MDISINAPMVSVIMPVYNGEKSCGRAIKSVQDQTYKKIELIVINDGSNDLTLEIVSKLAKDDSRIIVVDQINSGVSGARNRGLQKAVGDYIVFIDADDYMEDTFIEKMLDIIRYENTDVAMCGYRNLSSAGNTSLQYAFKGDDFSDTLSRIVGSNNINYLWNKMYRKDHISHFFNTDKMMGEDLEFNVQYFMNVNSISIIQDALYNYVVDSEGSLTKNSALVWNAITSDWYWLNKLIDKGVKAQVVNDKIISHIFYIIQQQSSRTLVKELLNDIARNKSLCDLIEKSEYGNFKFQIIGLLISKQAAGALFWGARIKNRLKYLL